MMQDKKGRSTGSALSAVRLKGMLSRNFAIFAADSRVSAVKPKIAPRLRSVQ